MTAPASTSAPRTRLGIAGVAQEVDAEIGADRARLHAARSTRARGSARRQLASQLASLADHLLGARTEQREQPALERALVQLHLVADAEPPDHVEQLLERDPLGVEQELVARVEDPQVAEHLALRRQKSGIATLSGGQRLDVV